MLYVWNSLARIRLHVASAQTSAASLFLIALLVANFWGCSKESIQKAVFKPAADDAGAASPAELAKLYEEIHQQKDMERYRETLDSHLATLRNWVPTTGNTKEELAMLFEFDVEDVCFKKLPQETPSYDTVVWYLNRTTDGGQSSTSSIIGLRAVGKLILVGRWPGGERLELDPGLAVVQVPTAGGPRYFVDRNDRILRLPGALLAKARAERSDGSNYFRAMPLGIEFQSAVRLPGTRKNSLYTKTWEQAVRDLEEVQRELVQ